MQYPAAEDSAVTSGKIQGSSLVCENGRTPARDEQPENEFLPQGDCGLLWHPKKSDHTYSPPYIRDGRGFVEWCLYGEHR